MKKKIESKPEEKFIRIQGAKLHNLKDISVSIPRNKLTVITGVSGSGKSSLAFDTLYAEGQRRFVQSLSSYARQFLERMNKPDVESITGLPPAIAIEQRPPSKNPRSTVGTSTEVYDYFRLLFGRVGTTICRNCGKPVQKDSPGSIVRKILEWNEEDKLYIMFPLPPQTRNLQEELNKLTELGFFRVLLKDSYEILDLQHNKFPENVIAEDILVLADRLIIRKDKETVTRMTDSVESALTNGMGHIVIRNLGREQNIKFSSLYECADCDILYYEPEPRLFSFNNPYGACPNCQGFGRTIGIDEDLIFPDKTKSINKGAIHPFRTQGYTSFLLDLIHIAPKYKIPLDDPIHAFTEEQMKIIWDGAGDYIGINGFFAMLEEKNYKIQNRVMIARYRGYSKCRACGGSRLRTSARQVFIGEKSIPEIVKLPLNKLLDYIKSLKLTDYQLAVSSEVLREIKWRLQLLVDIGLEYLTLERLSHTLSGGEAQRINLSSALGSSLVGTLYVLDEPSIGMHPRDTDRLIKILFKLRNIGNTIVVVEHDTDIMRQADYLIDLGPNAGEFGGELVYAGDFQGIYNNKTSLTGQYLSGARKIDFPETRLKPKEKITIINPRQHNLKMDKVEIPLGCMTVITGVSGSGKSTLVHDILYSGLTNSQGNVNGYSGSYEAIVNGQLIESVELVDQSPIGKSSRSTPATYTKVFDLIRELFSQTQAARQFGWKAGHFSFNVAGGRCEVCEGEGIVTVDMQFLPDVQLECEACKGTRYKKEVRNILYKGKSIVDVLNMTIDESAKFFEHINKITKKFQILQDVGLGYLKLGQPSTMLSGGEAQRIKLASHLDNQKLENTMFIFDEPTTGLHLDDISKLLGCFKRLVEKGNTVVVIEHNLYVINSADWIIDLGPEAGESGGEIVATGTPEQVLKAKGSHTAEALKKFYLEMGISL